MTPAPLATVAVALLFGWISVAPLWESWIHIGATSTAAPLAWLAVCAVAAGLGSWARRGPHRGAAPRPAWFDRGDLPMLGWLLAILVVAATGASADASWRLGAQLAVATAGSFAIGRTAGLLPGLPWRLAIAITIPGLAVAVGAIVEVATGAHPLHELLAWHPYYEQYRAAVRPIATQANPAPLGTYLLVSALLLIGALPAGAGAGTATWRRLLAWLAVPPIVAGLVLTGSRGAFAGLAVGLLALAWPRGWRARALCVAAAGAVMTFASLLPPPHDQFGFWRVLGTGGLLAQDRAIRRDAAVAMWADQPLLGVGFDRYAAHFVEYAGSDPRIAHLAGTPDNTWLTLLAENGLLGLSAFALLCASLLWRGARRRAADPADARVGRAATVTLLALMVNFTGYSALYWASPCLLFGLVCGLVSGRSSATRGHGPQAASTVSPEPGGGSTCTAAALGPRSRDVAT